jgi:hypothetical protein
MQVEAVLQMLKPDFDVRTISAKRRNKSNPWFKRGTLFGSAVDVLGRATAPLIAGKSPQAMRKQAIDLRAAILAALRKRNGDGVVYGEGAPVLRAGAQAVASSFRLDHDAKPEGLYCRSGNPIAHSRPSVRPASWRNHHLQISAGDGSKNRQRRPASG